MRVSRIQAIMLASAIAAASSLRAEEPEGRSRLKLEPAAEVPTQNVLADPYDDLGDFVATYTVRRRRPWGSPPTEDVNWGFYFARRRGDWVALSYQLEQPEAVPEGGVSMIKEGESWIWYRNQFEGVINNNILTLDPSDTPPDGPFPPFIVGMEWRFDVADESRPRLAPPDETDGPRRAALGWGPFATTDLGNGTVEQRSTIAQPWEILADGTRIHRYLRYIRDNDQSSEQARRYRLMEGGIHVTPADGAAGFDLPFRRVEVAAWKGKFPAELRYSSFSLPEASENTREALAARLSRMGSIDTVLSEYHLVLTDVRAPRADDLIEMNDFRPRIAAIRDGRHDAPVEEVMEPAADGSEVARWALDENSQMWRRVAAP